MSCEYKEKGGHPICKWLKEPDFCTSETAQYYRCMDSIASGNLRISYSQKTSWDRCPRKWYLEQLEGFTVRPHLTSIQMRMGSELQRIVSNLGEPTYFSENELPYVMSLQKVVRIIEQKEMLPNDLKWENEYFKHTKNGTVFHGLTDCEQKLDGDKLMFGEIKYTSNPDYYLTNFTAWGQYRGYFFLNKNYKYCYVMPIRVPQLRDKQDEPIEVKGERITEDIGKRMSWYFPGYNPKRKKGIKWGKPFWRIDFDMEDFEEQLDWTAKEIIMACKESYWLQKWNACDSPFPCDFKPICRSGGINFEMFKKKAQVIGKGVNDNGD